MSLHTAQGFTSSLTRTQVPLQPVEFDESQERVLHECKIISVAGAAEDHVLALNLAAYLGLCLRQSQKKVCIVELDFQRSGLGKHFSVYFPNVTVLIREPNLVRSEQIYQAMIHRSELNLSALLMPPTLLEGVPTPLRPELYHDILSVLREIYDYVILSAPTRPSPLRELACREADRLLVPSVKRPDDIQRASTWVRALEAAGARAELVLLRPDREVDLVDIQDILSELCVIGEIPSLVDWNRYSRGGDILATKNYSGVSEALAQVLYQVTGEELLLVEAQPQRRPLLRRLLRR